MANFELAIPKVLNVEGGYVNNPTDKGGETNFGITIKKAREHGYKGEMKDLTLDFVKQIYKEDYWDVLKLDQMNSQMLAEILFDFGVNCGTGTACRAVQRTLNLLNRNAISWLDMIVDGVMGSKTMSIINSLSPADTLYTAKVVIGLQFERYVKIVEADSTQETFFRGWVNRVGKQLQKLNGVA